MRCRCSGERRRTSNESSSACAGHAPGIDVAAATASTTIRMTARAVRGTTGLWPGAGEVSTCHGVLDVAGSPPHSAGWCFAQDDALVSGSPPPRVAYFSMAYGLHEDFHSYARGLGVLASAFMKSAGDLGLPVTGVGLRWAEGYTAQRIGPDGFPRDEWHAAPRDRLADTGARVRVRVGAREVECRVWRVEGFAIAPLYLLEPM